ncbi:MAG: type I methionyl aminopeptidase [Candidatus Omnitrophica bacterium]|nr:type I methionyl aminopeptidase [Candidatus Omnitrophota bacterium]
MISLKSSREIEIIRQGGEILKQVFIAVKPAIEEGITTEELDTIAESVIRKANAEPAFKGYRGFPKTACISVNEEVVHGIPGPRKLKKGDIVSFDIGAKFEGYYSDSARTWTVGAVDEHKQSLVDTARKSLECAIEQYQPGWRVGDLGSRIQSYIESKGFQVVRDYVGHGIGRNIHEDPQVPNYGKAGHGVKIQPGLVLAIEPMVTEGHHSVETLDDGWTVVTRDRKLASHYEEMIAFTEEGFIRLSADNEV